MESEKGEYWFEIKELLLKGYENGVLFCPLSPEHYLETSKKDYVSAKEHDLFFTKLSDGYSLKPELFITSQLISSRIRKNKITQKTYMHSNVGGVFENEKNYLTFNKANDDFGYLIDKGTESINSLRKITNGQKTKSDIKNQMFKILKKMQSKSFIERLTKLQKNQQLMIRGDQFGEKEVPNWIDLIIDQLLKKHKFSNKEIRKLILEFKNNGFDNIPTLNIRATLETIASIYSKKTTPNDQIDFMRIINGLPISDIFLTDKKRKNEILESELDIKYNTKVFSGVKEDLIRLIEELKQYRTISDH
ncbi:hypothetical protein [Dokdonia pacifica]|uniref:Uncharacterized protein n=1 Tax=Dokdonia pacifica TaxID=1627892 RepID=A0A239A672_9FLAO|nr:hypothetical protein [Dokdonia pacifica]SNR90393.1 hypothetical protein SAMN06265376_104140 [Dokdonia pacifica]